MLFWENVAIEAPESEDSDAAAVGCTVSGIVGSSIGESVDAKRNVFFGNRCSDLDDSLERTSASAEVVGIATHDGATITDA